MTSRRQQLSDLHKGFAQLDERTLEAVSAIDHLRSADEGEAQKLWTAIGQLRKECADEARRLRAELAAQRALEPEPDLKLSYQQAKELMEEVAKPRLHPQVDAGKETRFEQAKCQHCHGVHARKCPAVRTIDYYSDGKVKHVTYFPHGQWPEDQVIWLEDVMAALDTAPEEDDDDAS